MDHELFNNNDSFEQFLRESTDDFKMYPSRKIWYSLYNNLHPGRKWPSLAVCLILVSAILFMDVSNNNKINKRTQSASDSPIANAFTDYFTKFEAPENTVAVLPPLIDNNGKNNTYRDNLSNLVSIEKEDNSTVILNEKIQNNSLIISINNELVLNETSVNKSVSKEIKNPVILKTSPTSVSEEITNAKIINTKVEVDGFSFSADKLSNNLNAETLSKNKISEDLLMRTYQEDHAFYNKPRLSKFMKNATLQFYVTPSVGYRAWFKNKDVKLNNNAALITARPNALVKEEEVNQNAAYNMEAGLALNYSLSKKLIVKMGIQFNSTSYVINAGQLFHPTQTNLLLEDNNTGISNLEPHTSYYSNRQSPGNETRLFNKTTQFSLPLGIAYQIGRKKNISWFAGATIQPTYVAAGEANVLSADARNYVKMPSLLRTWNANTSFETFVNIQTKAGFSVNVGPQFRYQLLSTYNSNYNYSEKLYNIGIKLGITRGF